MNRVLVAAALLLAAPAFAQETASRDHTVTVTSTVPAMAGQGPPQIYVRERVNAGTVLRGGSNLADRVVLFIHGAGTPGEVAFDVPYPGLQLDGLSGLCRL